MSETKITGLLFQSMIVEGALAIAEKKAQANELNVFPVPDGDTGTNMSMTMSNAMTEVQKLTNPSLAKAADTAASALLRGARGNSGVILSLLFRGMAKRLREAEEATGTDFALAMREGVDTAYKAVMKPAEGTILTVTRVSAQHAVTLCQADPDLSVEAVFEALIERGKTALDETMHQNPVLEKAGVVDAGGFGFLAILEGMFDAFRGIKRERVIDDASEQNSAADFGAISDEEITFTYCTEFIAERRDKSRNVNRLREYLNSIGDSLVVVEDDDIVKVHVHTDEPNKALEQGLKFGPLLTVKIENMREQHSAKVIEGTVAPKERQIAEPEKKFGFVAVAAGDGISSVFSDLGCDVVVQGGQTMNPSTEDILRAVDATPAEIVFVFPNNKNIIMAAEQTIPLSETKQVIVVPTKNIPQGISAMLVFDADSETEDNVEAMTDAIGAVRAGQITYAARNSDFDGRRIKEGEYLALCEGKLAANSRKCHDAVKKLAKEMVSDDSSFATIIYGEGVDEDEAAKVEEIFRKENKNLEITVINGGQPVYYYIISVE
ncbi:MAG: DAK2 domain-containing protein [Butyricicoccus sp.]|nr:DAK2 domain-containing protein [Butyricicoccus sp.]MBQ8585794.1 DAK2 domain-containing protein [Butyricicoccus sp.]